MIALRLQPLFVTVLAVLLLAGTSSRAQTAAEDSGVKTVVAVGDVIVSRLVKDDIEQYSPEIARLLKESDATFGNFESNAFDIDDFKGWPEAVSGGRWFLAPADAPQDLGALGFTFFSRANNHAGDWGVQGLLDTDENMDRAGMVHAGSGKTLAQARAPAYLDTPKARFALVSASSTYQATEAADDPVAFIPGRPGISLLRTSSFMSVPQKTFDALRSAADASRQETNFVSVLGTRFMLDPALQTGAVIHYVPNDDDRKQIIESIKAGKAKADYLLFSLHAHEPGNDSAVPADFLPTFAHQTIEAGADLFVAHGPHRLRGIEIYKGKPIFYSLGNFIYSTDYDAERYHLSAREAKQVVARLGRFYRMTPESYDSVLVSLRFEQDALRKILLYPVQIEPVLDAKISGLPKLASAKEAQRILALLQELSRPYGTKIEIQDSIGVITLP